MRNDITSNKWFWVVVGVVVAWFVLVQYGGPTVVLLNRGTTQVCEVYFSYHPAEDGWGRDRLNGRVPALQSRDIRLPLYFKWGQGDTSMGFSGRLVSCEGEEMEMADGLGIEERVVTWEIR